MLLLEHLTNIWDFFILNYCRQNQSETTFIYSENQGLFVCIQGYVSIAILSPRTRARATVCPASMLCASVGPEA